LCGGSQNCWENAVKHGGFARAWKRSVDAALLAEMHEMVVNEPLCMGQLHRAGSAAHDASTKG